MTSYSIIFAGTPDFAANTLAALLQSKHSIKAVYTQPDRPAGRGRQLIASPVKQLALQHDLLCVQPATLKDDAAQKKFKALHADLLIVVAYGLILPLPILNATRLGAINIHASLLPRWRGAAPIQRAIAANDKTTGVTIMQMDEGLDTGPMLHAVSCPILMTDTSQTLLDKLKIMGADALLYTLDNLEKIKPKVQNDHAATYAKKITKEEAKINWQESALHIHCQIRAFNPWPVCFTHIRDETVRIWDATLQDEKNISAMPGTILAVSAQGLLIATGQGALPIKKIQFPGGSIVSVADAINARADYFQVGHCLG